MQKLKLSELIELESKLYRDRAAEELHSLCSFKQIMPEIGYVLDIDTAKAYLLRRGYSSEEIENALKNSAKGDLTAKQIDLYDTLAAIKKIIP